MTLKTTLAVENIMGYCQTRQGEMLEFLKHLVEMESPSRDPLSQDALLAFLEQELQELGFETMRMPGYQTGGYLYARPAHRQRSKPSQLLIGHCDTVWSRETLKKMPVATRDNKMSGPGVYDMKAGLTQLIFALKACKELGLNPGLNPLVLINSDEEIGSFESGEPIKRLARISKRAYVMEPPLGLDGKLKTARKGIGRFTIVVQGKAAHAGLDPEKGANAIVELSSLIQQLYAMNDFEKGITVNVGTIEGGISPNVVAPESRAVVDVRVLWESDGEEITKKIYALQPSSNEVNIRVEGGIGRPPMERTPRNQALWRMAHAKGLSLGISLEQATAGGGSDGNTTSQYTATLDGLGTTGDGAHAQHEFIYADQLPERTALLTLLILADDEINV